MAVHTHTLTSELFNNIVPVATTINTSRQRTSVLLVDNEPLFRQGLRTLLEFYNVINPWQFNIIGEATSGKQAINLALEQQPALILLDIKLSNGPDEGIAILKKLKELSYRGKVLVVSGQRDEALIFRAMQAEAFGYVMKDRLSLELHAAITAVMSDQIYLSSEVATYFFKMFHFYGGRSIIKSKKYNLTTREIEVLKLLVEGVPNEKIGKTLCITVGTVKAHLTAIFEKLEVTSRTLAIVKALKLGLV